MIALFAHHLSLIVCPVERLSAAAFSCPTNPLAVSFSDPEFGKWVFAAVFLLLLFWLATIPAWRLGQRDGRPVWWRNVRVWAMAVAATQVVLYVLWG